jgi:hypothetical protein
VISFTAFKLTLAGQYTLLHTFSSGGLQEGIASQLIEGSDGKLYGVTGGNEFFSLTTSGQYASVYHGGEGLCGPCLMVQGSDGIFYGTASGGGPIGYGLIFALDAGLPKPAPRVQHFQPQSGAVGTRVIIWGYNLLSAAVAFNGVAATNVANSGPNYVLATVPPGATTGPITVATPGGTVTTRAPFMVAQ